MKEICCASIAGVAFIATAFNAFSAAPNFAGEYADKKFLNGQAVFQMSLEQSRNTISVFFSAVYNDGHRRRA
jgi:hypothetical protein